MEVLYKRCCGIDIHKNMMVACVFSSEYYVAAEPPVRCGVSHLSGLTEPLI